MTGIQWCAVAFLVSCVSAPLIGNWLHNLRVKREFNQILEGAEARARKARIGAWLSKEEAAYLKDITSKYEYTDIANAITRDDQEAFSNDYQDQQPTRPSAA